MSRLLGKILGTILALLVMTLAALCLLWLILRVSRAVNALIGRQAGAASVLAHRIVLPAA